MKSYKEYVDNFVEVAIFDSSKKLTGSGYALKKAEEAQNKVFEWRSKVKKATTILKKWERRMHYYDKRAAELQLEWAKSLQQGVNDVAS